MNAIAFVNKFFTLVREYLQVLILHSSGFRADRLCASTQVFCQEAERLYSLTKVKKRINHFLPLTVLHLGFQRSRAGQSLYMNETYLSS